jgi:chromosomal replication initiator protein
MNTIETIIKFVSEHFEVPEDKLYSKSRLPEFVVARQVAQRLIKENSTLSFKSVGCLFNRDHSTVIHAVSAIQDRLDTDPKFKLFYHDIESKVKHLIKDKPYYSKYIWQRMEAKPRYF